MASGKNTALEPGDSQALPLRSRVTLDLDSPSFFFFLREQHLLHRVVVRVR